MSGRSDSMATATKGKVRHKSVFREYAEALALAIVFTIIIRTFLIQAFRIPTGSMEDTLLKGDFLFVNKFLYGAQIPLIDVRLPKVREPQRGDIIVFKYPHDTTKDYIKRCVAVEGQEVMIRNKVVYIDGVPQHEDYVKYTRGIVPGEGPDNWGPRTVPPGHLFMMGDNRDNSADSRSWGFLDKDLIKGKALFIYWSWDPDNKFLGILNTPRLSRIGDLVR